MKCRSIRAILSPASLLVVLVLAITTQSAFAANRGRNAARQITGPLDVQTRQALLAALDDEWKAYAFYAAVIDKFGQVRPFSKIILAERAHAAALLALCEKYNVAVPENRWESAEFEVPDQLCDACELGAEAERENVAIYDEFLTFVREPDIRRVMTQLRSASLNNHLPAFERCASADDNPCPAGAGAGLGRSRK